MAKKARSRGISSFNEKWIVRLIQLSDPRTDVEFIRWIGIKCAFDNACNSMPNEKQYDTLFRPWMEVRNVCPHRGDVNAIVKKALRALLRQKSTDLKNMKPMQHRLCDLPPGSVLVDGSYYMRKDE